MEELIQKIDDLINAINNNSVPLWLTIIGILVPIAISLLVWWQSYQQNKKNIALQKQITASEERLQKEICSKEIKVQMHGDILKIYDDFCLAQNTIGYAKDNVHTIFSNFNSNNGVSFPLQWINNVTAATNILCQSVNRAKLLLPSEDEELRTILESIWKKYKEEGIKADGKALSEFGDELARQMALIEKDIYECAGEEFNINSPKQVASILFDKLGIQAERVALRGKEVMQKIDFLDSSIEKDSLLVTPIGICLNFYEQNNNFVFVSFNGEKIK